MDWRKLHQACRRDALVRGASEADADDIAQEAVARAIEAAAQHVTTHARRTARSIATQLASGYTAERGPGRGITRPIPGSIGYVEDRGPHQIAAWQAGVMATCQLHRHGLSSPAHQESAAIAHRELADMEAEQGNVLERCTSKGTDGAARVARHRARQAARRAVASPPQF